MVSEPPKDSDFRLSILRQVVASNVVKVLTSFAFALMLTLVGGVEAELSPALEVGNAYRLTAEQLFSIADPSQTSGVILCDNALSLAPGAQSGSYVSRPIRMTEFSRLTLAIDSAPCEDCSLPIVSVSVFRTQQSEWSAWTVVPIGETVAKYANEETGVLLRYRMDFETSEPQSMAGVRGLIVTGSESLLSRKNIATLLVMSCALVLFLHQKKLRQSAKPKG